MQQEKQQDQNNWSDMANELTKTWMETGTQMWKSWFDLMGTVPVQNPVENSKPGFKYFAQRFVDNQDLFVRLLQLSFNTWQDIFPKVQSGENWQQTMNNYMNQMQTQLKQFSTPFKVSTDTAQLWQLYLKETQKFSQLWQESFTASLTPWSQTTGGTTAPWLELNDLYWNLLYEQTFGSLMQSPILGPTRELTGKLLRGFDAWSDLYRATIDYQIILANVQVRSLEELMKQLVSLAEKGKTVTDWREFQRLWSRVADEVFEQEFCKEDNLKIRGNFINSLNTYRIHQQHLLEVWLKGMNMPVRSEIDEIHQNLHELRKENKYLKKVIGELLAQKQQSPVTTDTNSDSDNP